MFSLIGSMGPEIPLALLLMGLLGLRAKVWPRTSLHIKAAPERVFELIDMVDGRVEDWGQTTIRTALVDGENGVFRKTYTTTLSSGQNRTSSAQFSIRMRKPARLLEIQREGLVGKPLANELISQRYDIIPEGDGTRLITRYEWGPRPLIAQLVARADLWGGAFRLRSLAERGVADNTAYQLISAGVALATGALSLLTFALVLGWMASALLIVALFVHEFGHLLAYRLMGQPWGRMIFIPFLGAIAIPRLSFESQGQAVFAALMGPGVSVLLSLGCTTYIFLVDKPSGLIVLLGLIATALNIFNLLPAEPLDGGVALRSVVWRLMGRHAHYGLMAVGAAIAVTGLLLSNIIIVIFGGLAVAYNLRRRTIDSGLAPLSSLQVSIACFSYVSLVTAYISTLGPYLLLLERLQPT